MSENLNKIYGPYENTVKFLTLGHELYVDKVSYDKLQSQLSKQAEVISVMREALEKLLDRKCEDHVRNAQEAITKAEELLK
jgi:hypothetical protein